MTYDVDVRVVVAPSARVDVMVPTMALELLSSSSEVIGSLVGWGLVDDGLVVVGSLQQC